jgi:hypothetical protein
LNRSINTLTHFDHETRYCSKTELVHVLHRLGLSEATIAEISAKLPDRVDLDASGAFLQSYGLTRDALVSRLGGSP